MVFSFGGSRYMLLRLMFNNSACLLMVRQGSLKSTHFFLPIRSEDLCRFFFQPAHLIGKLAYFAL